MTTSASRQALGRRPGCGRLPRTVHAARPDRRPLSQHQFPAGKGLDKVNIFSSKAIMGNGQHRANGARTCFAPRALVCRRIAMQETTSCTMRRL